jgi:hypothetical protein
MPDTLSVGEKFRIPFQIAQATLIANTTVDLVAPADGYVDELATVVDTAVTTGGTLTIKTGDALTTTVTGITQTVANATTKGTRQTTSATGTPANRAVKKGDRIAIVPASFATAGAINGHIGFRTADITRA